MLGNVFMLEVTIPNTLELGERTKKLLDGVR